LTPREEIKSETDPLWFIEIRRQNLEVCKGFDGKVILEADLSIFVKTFAIHTNFYMLKVRIYTMEKVFPLSFMVRIAP
jgi:hypothetical protein